MVSCIKHGGLVPERNAHLVGWDDTGSGPGVAHYACTPCVRDHGLIPLTTTRRDPAPLTPRRLRMTPLPVRCARCQQPIMPGQAVEVGEEQGTASSLVYVHRGPCPPQ